MLRYYFVFRALLTRVGEMSFDEDNIKDLYIQDIRPNVVRKEIVGTAHKKGTTLLTTGVHERVILTQCLEKTSNS